MAAPALFGVSMAILLSTAVVVLADRPRPHIVFILVDDLGWHDVSYNVGHLGENPAVDFTTPNIDMLAGSGIRLSQYYTQTVCTPTRVALLTGRQPVESGFHISVALPGALPSIPLDMPVLPEHMKDLGYDTYMAGKWHVGYKDIQSTPIGRGFDEYLGNLQGGKNFFTHDDDVVSNLFNGGFDANCECDDDPATANFTSSQHNGYDLWHADASTMTFENVALENEGKYDTDIVTDFIVDKIESRGSNPLFLHAAYCAPHDPWQAPTRFTDLPECAAIANNERRILCGMVKSVDEGVGKILAALQEEGIDDETLIVFSSDNGAAVWVPSDATTPYAGSNYPLRGGKVMNFEGGPKVPAFIWGEPIVPGSSQLTQKNLVYDKVFHVSDWSLTLQEAAGSFGPTRYYGADSNGVSHISSTSHWDALRDLCVPFWVYLWCSISPLWWCRDTTPPRGDSELMLYNWDNDAAGAARNADYKLYRISNLYFFDGHFDPSNSSREVVLCPNPFSPACTVGRVVPQIVMFKLSVDPTESNIIDATDYTLLTTEEQEAYDELSAYLDYWGSIAVPNQVPTFFELEFNDCNASPLLNNCSWAPFRNSDDPSYDLSAFGVDTSQTCRLNNAFNDPPCVANRADEWQTFASAQPDESSSSSSETSDSEESDSDSDEQ